MLELASVVTTKDMEANIMPQATFKLVGESHDFDAAIKSQLAVYRASLVAANITCRNVAPGKYQCGVCSKEFRASTSFEEHAIVHFDRPYKPFQCLWCSRGFTSAKSLRWHARARCAEAPRGAYLQRQKDALRNDAKFQNHLREQRSRHRSLLSQRGIAAQRMHGNCHRCSECGQEFRSPTQVEMHAVCHIDEKPYSCLWCDQSFTQESYLVYHAAGSCARRPTTNNSELHSDEPSRTMETIQIVTPPRSSPALHHPQLQSRQLQHSPIRSSPIQRDSAPSPPVLKSMPRAAPLFQAQMLPCSLSSQYPPLTRPIMIPGSSLATPPLPLSPPVSPEPMLVVPGLQLLAEVATAAPN